MTGGSGMKLLEYYKLVNRNGSLLKMLSVLLASKTAYSSNIVSLIWKLKVTKYNRLLFLLVPKTHHTEDQEFGSLDSLLPTPTTQEIEHPQATLTKNNRRLSKDGKSSHSLNLADTMKLWPTPRALDVEGGVVKDVQIANGRFFRQNEKGEKWGVKLRDAVNHTEEKKLWSTPTASDQYQAFMKKNNKGIPHDIAKGNLRGEVKFWPTPNASEARQGYQDRTKGKLGTQKSLSTEIIDNEGGRQATVGQLNSEWVTWLMGYPQGYLDISTENRKTSQELQQEKKTEPKN
jgi:hypothetical protein